MTTPEALLTEAGAARRALGRRLMRLSGFSVNVRVGDRIAVNGKTYRIRNISATHRIYLSPPSERLARFYITWPKGLSRDVGTGIWVAPDGIDVKQIRKLSLTRKETDDGN